MTIEPVTVFRPGRIDGVVPSSDRTMHAAANRPSVAVVATVLGAFLLSAGLSAASGPGDAENDQTPSLDLATAEVVDLTWALDEETLYWPTSPSHFELEVLAEGDTEGGWYYSANRFCTPEHGGTHLDAPIHFGEGRHAADEVPVDRLVGPAVVIDVVEMTERNPNYRLTPDDVLAWEETHGRVPEDSIVLLRTGWGRFWPDRERYFGSAAEADASDLHFPSYGAEAARLLIHERGVAVLGVDTASIDHGPSADFPVHRIAAAAEVPGLENVARLELVPPTGAWVAALPVKIRGGSGGPVRIVTFLPTEGVRHEP